MLLPTPSEFCPASLVLDLRARSFASDVVSTGQAFKSWDTCMDNKTCKIVVIVLIVIGSLLVFWVVSTLLRCLCCGVACLEACCFCCCRRSLTGTKASNRAFDNPNMYPPYQPAAQAAPSYFSQEPAYMPVNKVTYGYVHDDYAEEGNRSIPLSEMKTGYRGTDPFHDSTGSFHGNYPSADNPTTSAGPFDTPYDQSQSQGYNRHPAQSQTYR